MAAHHSITKTSVPWKIVALLVATAFILFRAFQSQSGFSPLRPGGHRTTAHISEAHGSYRIRGIAKESEAADMEHKLTHKKHGADYGGDSISGFNTTTHGYAGSHAKRKKCDYSSGKWVYNPSWRPQYNESCADVFKGWNCVKNRASHSTSHLQWQWQPHECDLPKMDPFAFLKRFRNKSIGFVGDSLNRNMYVSLVCILKSTTSRDFKKWRKFGADKGITFVEYNITVAYHRTNLLAQYARWKAKTYGPLEDLGFKNGYRVDVDVPDSKWILAPKVHDVLVLNTGHWWAAPDKFDPVSSPLLFFEDGKPLLPPKSLEEGLELVLNHMLHFVDIQMRSTAGLKFLRTQSPRHFEGGDWKDGGYCHRTEPLYREEVDKIFDEQGTNGEVRSINKHLIEAVKGTDFYLLDITPMSELRADAHPSISAGKMHEDCMHWCLPGVTDFWNDMFFALLLDLDNFSGS